MASIGLTTLIPYRERIISRLTGEPIDIPAFRLCCRAYWVPVENQNDWSSRELLPNRIFEAVVDTGAGFTILPYEIWSRCESEVRWIGSNEQNPCVSIAGAVIGYRLGRILLSIFDHDGRCFPTAWTFAKLLEPHEEFQTPVIGLRSPFLMNGRRIENVSSEPPAWRLSD
jgi:hypothetical protein